MADYWPGYDEPQPMVMVRPPRNHRPNRPRHQSDAFVPRLAPNGQTLMVDQWGQLMMPTDPWGRPQRSSSVSAQRPAQIIINNDNHSRDEIDRPVSAHGDYTNYEGALMERRPSNRSARSNSQVRYRPRPSSQVFEDEEVEYVDDRGRVHVYRRPSPRSPHRRSKEDEDKLKEHEEKIRELQAKEAELKELREKEKEKQRKKQIEEQIAFEEMEKEKKRKAREEEDKKLKAKAIEEYQEKMKKEKEKERKEREEKEAEFIELLRTTGLSEAEAKKKLKKLEKRKEMGITAEDDRPEHNDMRMMKPKPTYIKVHSKYISPDTLDVFELPWEFDDRDAGYIIIKQWVDERNQEILFNHTKKLGEQKRLAYPKQALKDDHARLVMPHKEKPRKKSPIKQVSYFLT